MDPLYQRAALAQATTPRYAVVMSDDPYQGPDDHDADLFDDELDVIDCPHCGAEIYAYAEKCPRCGSWLAMRHREVKGVSRRRKYRLWGWGVALLIVAFMLWLIFQGW
ncbi:MAG: zinc ribbon domain-containing protein [Phycisphaerales bacterium]